VEEIATSTEVDKRPHDISIFFLIKDLIELSRNLIFVRKDVIHLSGDSVYLFASGNWQPAKKTE